MGAEGKDGPVIGGTPDPRNDSDSCLGNAEGSEGKGGKVSARETWELGDGTC